MKALVISDVHGNLAALETVLAEPHDLVICLGDLVGTGPEPAACIQRIRAAGSIVVQGNHDRAIAERVSPGGPEPFQSLASATSSLAHAQLDADAVRYLKMLPTSLHIELADRRTLLVHATPGDPLYRAVGPDPVAWASELAGVEADAVLVGHTHRPFNLSLDRQRVINPGSVGLPLDGDPRAAFAVLENDTVILRRAAYPIGDTIAALYRANLPGAVIEELIFWLETGRAPCRCTPLI
jgi:putative phosphoesterase